MYLDTFKISYILWSQIYNDKYILFRDDYGSAVRYIEFDIETNTVFQVQNQYFW